MLSQYWPIAAVSCKLHEAEISPLSSLRIHSLESAYQHKYWAPTRDYKVHAVHPDFLSARILSGDKKIKIILQRTPQKYGFEAYYPAKEIYVKLSTYTDLEKSQVLFGKTQCFFKKKLS